MPDTFDINSVLPEEDVQFLTDKYPNYIVRQVGAELHIVIKDFQFPENYSPKVSNLLLRLPAGYPDAAPDMFWTLPAIRLKSGSWPQNSEYQEVPGNGPGVEIYENIKWQRWSRHFCGGWIIGQHGLRSFVGTIKQELKKGI